jgi:hypothetical protein
MTVLTAWSLFRWEFMAIRWENARKKVGAKKGGVKKSAKEAYAPEMDGVCTIIALQGSGTRAIDRTAPSSRLLAWTGSFANQGTIEPLMPIMPVFAVNPRSGGYRAFLFTPRQIGICFPPTSVPELRCSTVEIYQLGRWLTSTKPRPCCTPPFFFVSVTVVFSEWRSS